MRSTRHLRKSILRRIIVAAVSIFMIVSYIPDEMLKAFLVPVVLHGFYDFCLAAPGWYWNGVFFIFYLAAIAVAFVTIRKLAAEDSPVDLDRWYDTHSNSEDMTDKN